MGLISKSNDEGQNVFHMLAYNNQSEYMMSKITNSNIIHQLNFTKNQKKLKNLNFLDLAGEILKDLINQPDIYGITPLMLAIKNERNGSIIRLTNSGAGLRQDEENDKDLEEISFDLLKAASEGDYGCFMKYSKAGFKQFNKVLNIEGKSLAHVVSLSFSNFFPRLLFIIESILSNF